MSVQFAVVTGADGSAHVIPQDDAIHHEVSDDCICGTTVEIVREDDGSVAALIAHPSLDGREVDNGDD